MNLASVSLSRTDARDYHFYGVETERNVMLGGNDLNVVCRGVNVNCSRDAAVSFGMALLGFSF